MMEFGKQVLSCIVLETSKNVIKWENYLDVNQKIIKREKKIIKALIRYTIVNDGLCSSNIIKLIRLTEKIFNYMIENYLE